MVAASYKPPVLPAKKKPAAQKHKYQIWTGPTVNMGATSALLGGGGAVGTAYVAKKDKPDAEAIYLMFGAGVSGGLSIGLIQFWSSPNDFESTCTGIEMFGGKVSVGEWNASIGIGYGQSSWSWLDKPASGTVCTGDGLAVGLSLGVTTGTSVMFLKLIGINTNKSGERLSRSAEALDRAHKF